MTESIWTPRSKSNALNTKKPTCRHVEEADTRRKRKQGEEEERMVGKSRFARNLVSKTLHRSPTMPSSSSSQSPGNHTAKCSFWDSLSSRKLVAMDSNNNKASDSQVWHVMIDPNSSTGKPVVRSKKSPPVQDCSLTISLWRQTMSSTWRKSSRMFDRNLVALRMTKWSRSTPTR